MIAAQDEGGKREPVSAKTPGRHQTGEDLKRRISPELLLFVKRKPCSGSHLNITRMAKRGFKVELHYNVQQPPFVNMTEVHRKVFKANTQDAAKPGATVLQNFAPKGAETPSLNN